MRPIEQLKQELVNEVMHGPHTTFIDGDRIHFVPDQAVETYTAMTPAVRGFYASVIYDARKAEVEKSRFSKRKSK